MSTAIRSTSRTLVDHLQAEFEADPDLGGYFSGAGSLRVLPHAPADMTGTRSGLSVWLYRVAQDGTRLNRPPERILSTPVGRAPLLLRLHYLITAMTGSTDDDAPETEQVILGKALQCLHDHPHLSGTDLRGDFAGTSAVITIRPDPLALGDMARLWLAQATPYRSSVSYEAAVPRPASLERASPRPP